MKSKHDICLAFWSTQEQHWMNTMQSNDTVGSHNRMVSRDAQSLKSKKEQEAEAKLPDIGSYRLI